MSENEGAATPAVPRKRGFVRRHPVLIVFVALVTVLLVAVAGFIGYVDRQLADVPRFEANLEREGRPARVSGDAVNILLLGADDPDGADRGPTLEEVLSADEWDPGAFRSDTTMVLHIEANRDSAQLISIPRDSYVPIPGHGEDKINAAFSYGGPELTTATVEDLTGMQIDHIAVVNFEGFVGITEAIGGVDVQVAETVHDSMNDKTWEAGEHHLEGEEALLYVRQRYGLTGGDFDRVQRQQNFMRAIVKKIASKGTLANPVKVTKLVGELGGLLAVDDDFSNGKMRDLALSSRGLRASDITFATTPYLGTDTSPEGASIVRLDLQATAGLFDAVAHDGFAEWAKSNDLETLPAPSQVG